MRLTVDQCRSCSGIDMLQNTTSGVKIRYEEAENGRNEASETTTIDHESSDTIMDDYTSDVDGEHGFKDSNDHVDSPESMSSFSLHAEHKLSNHDADILLKRNWKYRSEMPAFDSSSSRWLCTEENVLKDSGASSTYGIKLKLFKHWMDVYEESGGSDFHSSMHRSFYSLCGGYKDILHFNKKPFYCKGGLVEDSSIRDAYIMHCLNHVFRTRDLVRKNDAKLAKLRESAAEAHICHPFLDHGFTRPKVLLLLPQRNIALHVVMRLIQLTPASNKVNVEYRDRFMREFGVEGKVTEKNSDIQNNRKRKRFLSGDREALLGANSDDKFVIGIKFTRKSIKLYSDFYSSDMIIASPLGLSDKIKHAAVDKEKDIDYLSSIEILVMDHTDVIAMQNWSHVITTFEHLNKLPSKQHGTDIMRVRPWYLDGQAKFYRQSIILSSYLNPEISALFNDHCLNFEGKLKLSCEYKGVLSKVIPHLRQVYERFEVKSIVDAADARFNYFMKKVFPRMTDTLQGGLMLFISSSLDYARVRNFLFSQSIPCFLCTEYEERAPLSKVLQKFGESKVMIYTERAHFYHRYDLRTKNLIIYSLPERKEFYPVIVNMLDGSDDMACTVLFSCLDWLQLERIVGRPAAKRMMKSHKSTFVIC